MWQSITTLFDGMGVIPMIIFAVGIIFCIIEIFVPGFGIFGITGTVFITIGVVVRYVLDFDIQHLIIMIMFVIAVVFLAVSIMVYSAKNGLLGKSALIENRTAIPLDYSKDDKEYVKMLGKVSFTETDFTPYGKFSLNNEDFVATTYGDYLPKGTKIQIVEIDGKTIYVKKM